MKIYEVKQNADGIEGRGPMVTVAFFKHQKAAQKTATGLGVMGVGDGEIKEHILWETLEEYQEYKKGTLRQVALSKLTHEERLALGV